MLTSEGCRARRSRLWKALPSTCDLLIVSDPQHLIYFGAYEQSPFVFRSNDAGAFLGLLPDQATLVADNLLQPFCDIAQVDAVELPTWYNGKTSAPHREANLARAMVEWVLRAAPNAKRIGIEFATLPAGVFESLRAAREETEWINLDPLIRPLKRAKDADELVLLKQAIAAADHGQTVALHTARPGMTELEVFQLVQNSIIKYLGRQVLVYGDFLSGPRCEQIGGPPSHRKIEPGDLFLLDFSVVLFGYRGDFANTFVVGGRPNERQRELYEACVEAIQAGEAAARVGAPARTVDSAVRGLFATKHLEANFTSHSGHGIGLGHPEPPYLVPESSETLMLGDVIAIEPGQYIPGVLGMRYERNYLVSESGLQTLSKHALTLVATD